MSGFNSQEEMVQLVGHLRALVGRIPRATG
jgi:hypothetical protein